VSIERALGKRGVRALGIAESFRLSYPRSVFVGTVMRSDWYIDGIGVGYSTVGGTDATDTVIKLIEELSREDIHVIMVDGCIVSFYNFVDISKVYEKVGVPVICLTFEKAEGRVDKAIRALFKDYDVRLKAVEKLGEPKPVDVGGGIVWVRTIGLDVRTAQKVISRFIRVGKRPEPIRISKLIARAILLKLIEGGDSALPTKQGLDTPS